MSDTHAAELLTAANKAVTLVASRLGGEHEGKGGFFRLFDVPWPGYFNDYADVKPLVAEWVGGDANRAKQSRYEMFSFEKAIRLAMGYHTQDWGPRASMTCGRNPRRGMYGGALLFRGANPPGADHKFPFTLLSLSGLPELGDEAAMYITPTLAGWSICDNVDTGLIFYGRDSEELQNPLAKELYAELTNGK